MASGDSNSRVLAPAPVHPRALSGPRVRYPPERTASPATAAAAMSLGTLAAAAQLAAAEEARPHPSGIPHAQSRPSHTNEHQQQQYKVKSISGVIDDAPPHLTQQQQRQQQLQASKTAPTPVAPAPTSEMHHSQTQSQGFKPKQKRYRASPEQLRQLIARFDINPSPSGSELTELASGISMPTQSVVLWFKNRRARVPHKKAEKAENAKRAEETDVYKGAVVSNSRPTRTASASVRPRISIPAGVITPTLPVLPVASVRGSSNGRNVSAPRTSSFSPDLAAAASMAEMAMAFNTPQQQPQQSLNAGRTNGRRAGRNITNHGCHNAVKPDREMASQPVSRSNTIPDSSPSSSPPLPVLRTKAEHAIPFDPQLAIRLSNCPGGSSVRLTDFVAMPGGSTPRRPRTLPPTPRILSQLEYKPGDKVEVLETGKGICRSWYSGTVVTRRNYPRELSLGESVATSGGFSQQQGAAQNSTFSGQDNGESQPGAVISPRTVRSPAASPTPLMAKATYTVEFDHRFVDGDTSQCLQEEVLASRMRPLPPPSYSAEHWRPEAGEAVEVLRDGAWFVAVMQTHVMRKGYMVSFESGDVQWVRRDKMRPYQIWRGGEEWVVKTKPPLPVVRKSVGLTVTHPPGGKRKRLSLDPVGHCGMNGGNATSRETRGRSKRARSMSVDRSGPDGLPEGWRMDYSGRQAGLVSSRMDSFYIAPDGNRLRSLKEAQRYVRMMGPV